MLTHRLHTSRKQKLEELFESIQTIRRTMVLSKKVGLVSTITGSQWMVLKSIEGKKEVTVKEVATHLGVSSSAVTQLIDTLVREGFVLRTESKVDRRQVALRLSGKMKKSMQVMKKHILSQLVVVFDVLTDNEFNQYLALNKKIVEAQSQKNNINTHIWKIK